MANKVQPLDGLLVKVAKLLTTANLEELRIVLWGTLEAVMGEGMDSLDSPLKIFGVLKNAGMIKEGDLCMLQDALCTIERTDLVDMMCAFEDSQREGSVAVVAERVVNPKREASAQLHDLPPLLGPSKERKHTLARLAGDIQNKAAKTAKTVKPETKIKLRDYQLELAAPGLAGDNCIICAPTGSGKTYTAAHICYTLWQQAKQEDRSFKALFLVCIRNLISQQTIQLKRIFGENDNVVRSVGDSQSLPDALEGIDDPSFVEADVAVLTAAILVNCLSNNDGFNLDGFDLLIFDECHHTDLKHPYNKVMKAYHQELRGHHIVPQIIGLTASLGAGDDLNKTMEHYIHMCANMNCHRVNCIRDPDNKAEFDRLNPPPNPNQIRRAAPRDLADGFMLTVEAVMRDLEQLWPTLQQMRCRRGTSEYEQNMVGCRKTEEEEGNADGIFICATLLKYNWVLMTVDDLRFEDVLPNLNDFLEVEQRPVLPSGLRRQIYELHDAIVPLLDEFAENEKISDNGKLVELKRLIIELFRKNPKSRGIVLTRTRFNVGGLLSFIERIPELQESLRCSRFVGKGPNAEALTDAEQDKILNTFRKDFTEGGYNLLVSTNILEEGLDVPECNFVIRYNYVSNEIGSVQSRGRARAKNSECYLIVNCGSLNEKREYENMRREHSMMEALDEIDQLSDEHLRGRITKKQKEIRAAEEKEEEKKRCKLSSGDITIHCMKCQSHLCNAEDMINRQPHYIVISERFEQKIRVMPMQRREFTYDTQTAAIFCRRPDCGTRLGMKLEYKHGSRPYGYILNKSSVSWKKGLDGKYMAIKQWSKVPFKIPEETPTS